MKEKESILRDKGLKPRVLVVNYFVSEDEQYYEHP